MSIFKVALLQIIPTGSVDGNLLKSEEYCLKAKELGADLILLPEIWQLGYQPSLMNINNAIDESNDYLKSFASLAKTLNIAIATTYIRKNKTSATNNMMIIDRFGNKVLDYAKVHICNFKDGTETLLSSGKKFHVAELDFAKGKVKIGAMICMDREFSESARTLSLMGAEVLVIPNSCRVATCDVLGDARLAGLRAMAYENLLAVAMTNYPSPKEDGHSCAFDNLGRQLVMADNTEQILIAEFNLNAIRETRQREWPCRGAPARRTSAYYKD